MATRSASLALRNQILSTCIRLFLKQGYHNTTVKQIAAESGCATGSFQNLFKSKENVLAELVELMFSSQFKSAKTFAGRDLPPEYTYALETSIQLAITETDENLRDIYIEAYSQPAINDMICRKTSEEMFCIFGSRFPGCTVSDFYELDIGSNGLMRGYMSKKCDIYFTLERKIDRFLGMSLSCYRVTPAEQADVIEFIHGIDILSVAHNIIPDMLSSLKTHFENASQNSTNTYAYGLRKETNQ